MGRPRIHKASLFMVRGASILAAGMLLFAVLGHAHAENLDGYGIKPVAGAPDAADYGLTQNQPSGSAPAAMMPAAAANNSYNAAPVSGGYYPPSSYPPSGYTPAPGGFNAGPSQQAAATPLYAPPTAVQPQRPTQPQEPRMFGYRPGDGMAAPAYGTQPGGSYGYYQTLNAPDGDAQQGAYPRANADYVLGPGDKIKLKVFDETDLSGDYTVDGSGFVRLPLIGQVRAAGSTAMQLEASVGGALARGYLKSPRVSVEVTTYRPFYIIGAVNRPGEYPYVNHMNALNAIALAGGFLPSAVESVIFVRREGSNREVEMATDRSTPIYPGDVIRVHNTFFSEAMTLFSPITGLAGTAALATTIH